MEGWIPGTSPGMTNREGCAPSKCRRRHVMADNTDLTSLETALLAEIAGAGDLDAIERVRIAALGKKGQIPELMARLGTLPADQRKTFGQAVNGLKTRVGEALEGRKTATGARRPQRAARDRAGRRHAACAARAAARRAHPSRQPGVRRGLPRSSPTWASPSPKVPTSRPMTSTSPSSISPRSTRPGRSTIPST